MKRVGKDKGDYKIYGEGLDNDIDGKHSKDGIGGLDLHRNYPENWRPEPGLDLTGRGRTQLGAGAYPLSEDETRKVYDYGIIRSRNTFQVNKYLFLRAIFEYNTFYRRLTTDGLISFTYVPGTVVHVGYGSAYEKLEWTGAEYIGSRRFLETRRGFFFKVSYLWRW